MLRSKKVKTVLLSILLAICFTLFPVSFAKLAGNDSVAAAAASYTSINAELADKEYTIYAGITTVGGLKKNLVVTGMTDDNDSSVLFDDEYSVRINGQLKADDYLLVSGDDNGSGVAVTVVCGTLTSDILIPLSADAPDLTGDISVTVNGTVTDDYTADTIYKVLTVTAGTKVLSPDLYTVEMADIFGKTSTSVKVTVGTNSKTIDVSVSSAPLLSVDLSVKSDYTLSDGKYKNSAGQDVFIQGENPNSVFYGKLDVTAVFANGKRAVELSFNSQNELEGATGFESARINGLNNPATANESFTVTLSRNGAAKTSPSLSITFAAPAIIGIEFNEEALADWNSKQALYPYTMLNLSEMKGSDGTPVFTLIRNDGQEEKDLSNIKVDGSLAPDATVTSGTYSKKIKIVSNDDSNVCAYITLTGINYVAPIGPIISVEGTFATQIMHHAPDLSGLNLVLEYEDEDGNFLGTARIPLVESEANVTTNTSIITNTTTSLTVSGDYNGLPFSKRDGITLVKDRITLPMPDLSTVTYTQDCEKSFENFQSDIMQLDVFVDEQCETPAEGVKVEGGTVKFGGGGVYYIRLSLKPDVDGKIKAANGNLYPAEEFMLYYEGLLTNVVQISSDGSYCSYKIQINKGTLAVNLALDNPEQEIFYGDSVKNLITVTGTSNGLTHELASLGVDYQLIFVRSSDNTFDYNSMAYIEGGASEIKLNAGVYTVYAVTKETEAYLAGKVRENKGITITVLPKEISTGLTSSAEYDRKEYELSDFVTYNNFANGEDVDDVLSVSDIKGDAGQKIIRYVGEYTVSVKLIENGETDEYKYNYIWSDDTYGVQTIKIEITQKKITIDLTLDNSSFYYGAVSFNPSVNNPDPEYFTVDLSAPTYYKGTTRLTETDLNLFDVGTYKVVYPVSPQYIDGEDGENSFVLSAAEATFTISAAQIAPVTVDGKESGSEFNLGDYVTAGYTKTLTGWTSALVNGAANAKASAGLNFVIEYTDLSEGHTITLSTRPSDDGDVSLIDAGTYVVTVSLKANYVWEDGTNGDITFTFIIDRAALTEPALSDGFTYNGKSHDVSISDWNALTGKVQYTVTGTSFAAKDITVVTDAADATFAVIWAGDYNVVFSLTDKNNYGWGEAKSIADVTKVFTVEQADLTVSWSNNSQDFDDTKNVQDILAVATVSGTPDDGKLKVTEYKIYSDSACTQLVESVTEAGTYWLKVTAFALNDGVTDFSTENYKLNDEKLIIEYTVNSQSLVIPVLLDGGNIITVDYNGSAYIITDFFVEGTKYYGSRLDITIEGGTELKDVINGSYTVTVKPSGNYSWDDGTVDEFTYTFIINRYEIEFDWVTTEFTYDGSEHTPTATVIGTFADDFESVKVEVGVTETNAGSYDIAFDNLSLTGYRAHNYVLKNVLVDEKLVIKRAVVAVPEADDSATFDESIQSIKFTLPENSGVGGWNWANVKVTADGECTDGSYGYSNGTLSFFHAGTYTVTFTLPANYCWTEGQETIFEGAEGYVNEHVHTVTVGKMEVTAPALGANRAIELGEGTFSEFDFGNNGVYTVCGYGEYADGAYTVIENFQTLTRQVYFVKLTISPTKEVGNFKPFAADYYWVENEEDTEGLDYLTEAHAGYGKISDDKLDLYLCFIVTKTQIKAEFTFNGYTFGDNGWYKDGDDVKTDVSLNEVAKYTLTNIGYFPLNLIGIKEGHNIPDNVDYTITVTFFTDNECTNSVEKLVNGLPWNAGTYYARIVVKFDESVDWQDFPSTCSFTVSTRALEIEWDDKEEAEYNGREQTRTAGIANMRYSTSACSSDEIPELTVKVLTANETINVLYVNGDIAAYSLKVTGVTGGNYTVDGGEKLKSTFTIIPKKLTVSAKELTYTYGDSLDFLKNITDDNYGDYYSVIEEIYTGEYGCVMLVLEGLLDKYGLPCFGGTYSVVPRLTNEKGNYTLSDGCSTATFTVNKREVTVKYTGDTSHVYGNELALNGSVEYSDLGQGRSLPDVFVLYLTNANSVVVDDGDKTADAGEYTVKLRDLDGNNYTFIFEELKYQISPADITGASAKGYSGEYDGNSHTAIIDYSASAVNGETLTWWIAEVGTEEYVEIEYGKVTNVSDSGEYKVKVTAPNHSEYELGTVTVSITQVTITVSVTIDIFYGETGPEAHGSSKQWFKQSFGDLIAENGIYNISYGNFKNDDWNAFKSGTLSGLVGTDSFSYNYAEGVTYAQGDGVGYYKLVFIPGNLVSENYKFVDGGNSYLQVAALPVTVQLQNLTAKYDDENAPAVDTAIVSITTTQTSKYDGNVIDIYYGDDVIFAVIVTATSEALDSSTGKSTNIVGEYPIEPEKKSNNFAVSYAYQSGDKATYTITKADNAIVGDYNLFEVAKSYLPSELISENAWVYGVYTSTQTDGYNAYGNQKAVKAEFTYNEEGAEVTYTLYKGSDVISSVNLADLFSGSLSAGDYCVKISFPEGHNYNAVDVYRYFRVGKRTLTVTADSFDIQYGENAPEYTYTVNGYAITETGTETGTENEAVFGEKSPVFGSEYKIGFGVDNYEIIRQSVAQELENYTVKYIAGILKVTKRQVTIVIEHKESSYAYYNDNGAKLKELTYRIISGSIYNGEDVFVLRTNAGNESTTGDVGEYPIYAVFNADYQKNYEVTIVPEGDDKLYSGEFNVENALLVSKDAGIYTITAAKLSLTLSQIQWYDGTNYNDYESGENPTIYDGREKGITATANDKNINETFEARYRKDGTGEFKNVLPKDVGHYEYVFVSSNANYSYDTSGLTLSFDIYPAQLTVSYGTNSVNDGWTHSETYKGSDYALVFTFGGLKATDKIATQKPSIATQYPAGVDGSEFGTGFNPFSTVSGVVDSANAKFTLTARNAGTYTVTLTLDNSDLMKNYNFGTANNTRSITFTIDINQAALTVNAVDATVEYGTSITSDGAAVNRFSGFTLDNATLAIKEAEGDYFITDGVTYATGYSANGSSYRDRCAITPSGIVAYNYSLSYGSTGILEVLQRKITFKLKGFNDGNTKAQADYNGTVQSPVITDANASDFLVYVKNAGDNSSIDWYGSAIKDKGLLATVINLQLSLVGGALDAGSYAMSVMQLSKSDSNYEVSFENYSTEDPLFKINKISLTIQAVGGKTGDVNFNITYGDSTDGYFAVRYEGFVEADGSKTEIKTTKFDGQVSYSVPGYAPWTSHAGQKFTVTPGGLSFTNYLVTYQPATMTVVARAIIVETEDRTYTEKVTDSIIDYNGGASGIYHVAPVTFRDVDGNVYTVDYNETNGVVTAGKVTVNGVVSNTTFKLTYKGGTTTAPVVAGGNEVTIALTVADFIFDINNISSSTSSLSNTQVTFDYEVKKKGLDFNLDSTGDDFFKWEETDAGTKSVSISDFIDDVMEIVSVQRISNGETYTFDSNVLTDGGYYAIENGLKLIVYPNGIGIYVVTVRFNSAAEGNYVWNSGNREATVQFTFATDSLRITELSIQDWVYLGYDSEINKVTISNSANITEAMFMFTYAQFTGDVPAGTKFNQLLTNLDAFGTALNSLSYKGLPTDAGVYILKAEYRGEIYGTVAAYCLFNVTRKTVDAPVIDSVGTVYNAGSHTVTVTYDSDALGYTYTTVNGNGNGIVSPAAGKVTITAVNADTYVLSFTISNTGNYIWKDGVEADSNGAVKLSWVIAKADDNEVNVQDIITEYGDSYTALATSKYGGEFTYFYAVRGVGETHPSENAVWKSGSAPVNAGYYWIKAVCGETPDFKEQSNYGKLTIDKVIITATPEGYMTYGDAFADAFKDIIYTGWKKAVLTVTENNIEYSVAGYDGYSLLNVKNGGYVLSVSGSLTVSEGDDDVYGFAIENYEIVIADGIFTVNKKDIEVTIDNLSSVYGEDFDPSKVTLTQASLSGLIEQDRDNAIAALNINPVVMGTKVEGYYNAMAYVLSSEGHENSVNYNVTVRAGIYSVTALDVYITVNAGGGEYGNVTPASKVGVFTVDGDNNVEELFGELSVEFRYSGIANDGKTTVNNSVNAPALAGSYTAVARINNGNFNLVTDKGTPSVAFIVARKAIEESEISVEEIKFNNQAQSPVIIDGKYSDLYTAEEVAYVNVQDYTVKLTLKDADNYKWSSVDGIDYNLPFSIIRGDNSFTSDVTIIGWNFGDNANIPETETAFGDKSTYIYTYSAEKDGTYTTTVPTAAGVYWVKVTVPQSDNYNEKTSEPVSFTIGKRAISAPTLDIVTEGENTNTTYTGSRLQSTVKGYDPALMRIIYEGDLSSTGSVAIYALNAGEYKIYIALNDTNNYMWAEGTALSDGNAQLIWTVERKKIDMPTMPSNVYMVNGRKLTFTPVGFDSDTMEIEGNTTSYGGVFKVTVSIKDTMNFEWADGSVEDITFDWAVVGWDTVFVIVISVLGVAAVIAAVAIGIQFILHKRKKRAQAAREAESAAALRESLAASANGGAADNSAAPKPEANNTQGGNNNV